MNELELCRLCANFADDTNSQKLFERNQRNLLRLAEDLLGLELQNAADLPQFICEPCQEQTMQAHEFRERCIRVQLHFAKATAAKVLPKVKKEHKLLVELEFKEEFEDDQLPPIEEVIIEKDDEDFKLIGENVVLLSRDELMNANDSSNDDDWNDLLPMLDSGEYHETIEENDRLQEEVTMELHLEASQESPQSLEIQINDYGHASSTTTTKHKDKKNRRARKSRNSKEAKKPKVDLRKCKQKQQFVCEQCGRNFNCLSYFELHMSRHAGVKQFKCETCPDTFFTKADLKRHTYKHTGERPVVCRYCDRRFIDHSLRTKHEKTHTNERPHACHECGKKFNQKQHLDVHMQLHTGERFFSCELCNSTFQRKSNMTAHFSTTVHKQNLEKQQKLQNHTNNIAEGAADSTTPQDLLNAC